jgi:hypothetical protein
VQKSVKLSEGNQKDEDDGEYTSGLSSDGDLDMLTEMEVLRAKTKSKKKGS